MISFPNVNELHGFDSRRKALIAMLAINMRILQERVLTSLILNGVRFFFMS
jgi:hypothetical protein